MKSFTDSKGQIWEVAIDANAVKRVRGLVGVDLMTIVDPEDNLFMRFQADPILIIDAIYAIVKPQADALNITPEEFGRRISGEIIDAAALAMEESLINFFPPRKQGWMRTLHEKVRQLQEKASSRVSTMISSGKMDAMVTKELDRIEENLDRLASGEKCIDAPGSPASTPDR